MVVSVVSVTSMATVEVTVGANLELIYKLPAGRGSSVGAKVLN